jgi:hypothetical protein
MELPRKNCSDVRFIKVSIRNESDLQTAGDSEIDQFHYSSVRIGRLPLQGEFSLHYRVYTTGTKEAWRKALIDLL